MENWKFKLYRQARSVHAFVSLCVKTPSTSYYKACVRRMRTSHNLVITATVVSQHSQISDCIVFFTGGCHATIPLGSPHKGTLRDLQKMSGAKEGIPGIARHEDMRL